jgi:hypothetical protein
LQTDVLSLQKSAAIVSPSQQQKLRKPFSADDDTGVSSTPTSGAVEPVACKLSHFFKFIYKYVGLNDFSVLKVLVN